MAFLYTVELNTKACPEKLIEVFRIIGNDEGFNIHIDGDRMIFASRDGMNFTKLISRLANASEVYGVDYVSLLDD